MADEQHLSRDQYRADVAELRGDLKEEMAGLRQDVAVLTKSMEYLTQMLTELRTHMDRQFTELRQDLRDIRVTTERQMWVLIAVVVVSMIGGMIKIVFFL